MKAALVLFAMSAVFALGACKDQAATQEGVRSSANPDGQQLRKKYEEAGKQADERRKAAE